MTGADVIQIATIFDHLQERHGANTSVTRFAEHGRELTGSDYLFIAERVKDGWTSAAIVEAIAAKHGWEAVKVEVAEPKGLTLERQAEVISWLGTFSAYHESGGRMTPHGINSVKDLMQVVLRLDKYPEEPAQHVKRYYTIKSFVLERLKGSR